MTFLNPNKLNINFCIVVQYFQTRHDDNVIFANKEATRCKNDLFPLTYQLICKSK
jgi:hypothetical protein